MIIKNYFLIFDTNYNKLLFILKIIIINNIKKMFI